jgi:hypothetical protein
MTMATMRQFWTLPGVALVALAALGVFSDARAAPSETFSRVGRWDPRPTRVFEFPAPPAAGVTGSMRPFAPRHPQPRFAAPRGFYETHLAPRMSADRLKDDAFVAARFGDPASRQWTSDPAVVELVEKRTIRSITHAFKGYAIEQLGINRWSLRVAGSSRAAPADDSRGVRFHLGFSRLAPRADLLIPVTSGRVVLSADARGRVRTTFERDSSRLQFAADLDVPARTATVRLRLQF